MSLQHRSRGTEELSPQHPSLRGSCPFSTPRSGRTEELSLQHRAARPARILRGGIAGAASRSQGAGGGRERSPLQRLPTPPCPGLPIAPLPAPCEPARLGSAAPRARRRCEVTCSGRTHRHAHGQPGSAPPAPPLPPPSLPRPAWLLPGPAAACSPVVPGARGQAPAPLPRTRAQPGVQRRQREAQGRPRGPGAQHCPALRPTAPPPAWMRPGPTSKAPSGTCCIQSTRTRGAERLETAPRNRFIPG